MTILAVYVYLGFLCGVARGFLMSSHPPTMRAVDGATGMAARSHNPMIDPQAENEDGEWHPMDPAATTPQFLSALWHLIARGNQMVKGETYTVMFPMMEENFNPRYLNLVTAHLDSCKDVCDYFGITTTLAPYMRKGKVVGFTVKSYRNPDKDPDNMEWDYDPLWDGEDFNYEGVDELEGDVDTQQFPEIVDKIPDDDEVIIDISKKWVNKICSDMGICPFTNGPDQAGLPLGPVFYCVDRASSMEEMYARYWKEVVRIEQQSEKDISTTLLITPEFCMDNVEMFENFSTTLTQPLAALGIEDVVQLVFFHPQWFFRDGGERGGSGMAANYARRSPWPMINILRTKQVRAAQKGIPTGLVYKQNEKTLASVGSDKLETMLRLRDWEEIADVKVNRREMEALRVAQDFQQTGAVDAGDASLYNDVTPAANKVSSEQINKGDLMNVVSQALEKRLGVNSEASRLSGPETSATIMASDFLLQALEDNIEQNSEQASAQAPEDQKSLKMKAARQAILDDMNEAQDSPVSDRGDAYDEILMGKPGIGDADDEDAIYSSDRNPANFY